MFFVRNDNMQFGCTVGIERKQYPMFSLLVLTDAIDREQLPLSAQFSWLQVEALPMALWTLSALKETTTDNGMTSVEITIDIAEIWQHFVVFYIPHINYNITDTRFDYVIEYDII